MNVIGIEAEPVLESSVTSIFPVIELPVKVPVKSPVTVLPPGVTNEVLHIILGDVPEI